MFRILIVMEQCKRNIEIVSETTEIEQYKHRNGERIKVSRSSDLVNHLRFPQSKVIFTVFSFILLYISCFWTDVDDSMPFSDYNQRYEQSITLFKHFRYMSSFCRVFIGSINSDRTRGKSYLQFSTMPDDSQNTL